MLINYGKLLDKQDLERANSIQDDTYYQNPEKLKKLLFSETVKRMHDHGSTLFTGVQAVEPKKIAPFLYFYDSISLEICPHCPQAQNPALIKPFLERGLVSIFLNGSFSDAPLEFQKLAYEYPEFFVGPRSLYQYKYWSLNEDPLKCNHENHYCVECIKEKILPHLVQLEGLNANHREYMDRIFSRIMYTPMSVANELADLFVDTLKNVNPESLQELNTTTNLAYYLSSSNALDAIPQISMEFIESSELFLEPLRLYHNENIDLKQYLDLVKDFRGVLSPNIIPTDKEKILTHVTKINDEVNKIKSSNRLPLGILLSNFVIGIPSLLSRIVSHGSYGLEGVYDTPPKGFRSKRLAEIEKKILSKYFGVSKVGIQIWQIGNKIDKLSKDNN